MTKMPNPERCSELLHASRAMLPATAFPPPWPAASSPIYDHLSSDLKVLHIEFPVGNGLQTIWSLHPPDAPSSDFESERGQTVTRIAGSITEQTPAAYRVTFLRTVTESGAAGTPQQEIVAFPFGRVTRARIFGAFDISRFYGNPHKRP